MKRKIQRFLLTFTGSLLSLILLGVTFLQLQTYPAEPQANHLAQTATKTTSQYRFFQGDADKQHLILYPGALVESTSYASLAHQLQEDGYNVYLIQAPLNLPILDSHAALNIMQEQHLASQDVILIGHSLGGVVAASNAQSLYKDGKDLAGLVLLASYPTSNTDLSKSNFPVLAITADQDKIINQKKYKQAKQNLPANTSYTTIKGGNHSGFGLYGQQKGDGQTTISKKDQEKKIVELIKAVVE